MITENELRQAACAGVNQAGEKYSYLTVQGTEDLAQKTGISKKEVELAALKAGVIPQRYQRHLGTVGLAGQIKLLEASVGLAGLGGLGGFVAELLARLGVGSLVVVDYDTFTDSNLNRQLLALENNLSRPKTEAALKRIKSVNSAVEVTTHHLKAEADNIEALFAGCRLVVDCLDNLSARFALEKCCVKLGIPLVHGAIAGFLGQVALIRPDHPLLELIYGEEARQTKERGAETVLGIPAPTASLVASWQATEAVKYLAGLGTVLAADKLLMIDMLTGHSYQLALLP